MSAIPPTLENIQKAVSLIKEYYYETSPSINPLQSFLEETPNPLKGKCYICSATIQRIFGKENISLWIRRSWTFIIDISKNQRSKTSRNPKTGEKVIVDEKKSISFKMSKDLFNEINDE